MADTAVPNTAVKRNDAVADPAGTAIVHANKHVITPTKGFGKVLLRLTNTTASEKVISVVAGANPPAQSAGQGDLALTFAAGNVTPVVKWVVLESARFVQADGAIHITVAASTTGNIAAFQLP